MHSAAADRMPIKPLIPLCLAAFAGFLNLFGMNPFFVDIAQDTGSTVSLVGYSSTAALLMTALSGAIIGPIAHRVGTRRTLVVGIVVAAAGAAATALAMNYGGLILGRLLAGVGGSVTGGVTIGMAALIYEGRQRQRALALVTSSMAMAVVVGIFLMTTMAEPWGWRGAFLILGAALLFTAALNQFMLDRDEQAEEKPAASGFRTLIDAYRPIVSHKPLQRLLASCMMPPAVINGATAYVGAFMLTQHDVSLRMVGLIFTAIGATYVVGNLLAGNLRGWQPHVVFSAGVFLMGLFWFAGYLAPAPPLLVAVLFSLATLAGGVCWVVLLSMVADRTPANVGTAMVLTSSLHSLGAAGGIALSAGLLGVSGYWAIGAGVFAVAIIAAGLGWVGPPVKRPEEAGHRVAARQRLARQE